MVRRDYGKQVTIRVPLDKLSVKDEFKKLVIEDLHSDICFTTVMLWELFVNAFKQVPNPENPITMQFLRQNIQLNMGCNVYYDPGMKARRKAPGIQTDPSSNLPTVTYDKNKFLPLLLEEWDTLPEKSREFWRQRLLEAGIIPTSEIQSPIPMHIKSQEHNNLQARQSMEQCKTIVCKPGLLRRFWRVMVTPVVGKGFWRSFLRVMTTPL